jgi:hypothetical protein
MFGEYLTTQSVVEKSQTELAIERTEKLLDDLKKASDFEETKNAVVKYISDIDCYSGYEENPGILGDIDFARLYVQSLDRRGKVPIEKWAPMIIRCTQTTSSLVD